jgi:hypothetical protein
MLLKKASGGFTSKGRPLSGMAFATMVLLFPTAPIRLQPFDLLAILPGLRHGGPVSAGLRPGGARPGIIRSIGISFP